MLHIEFIHPGIYKMINTLNKEIECKNMTKIIKEIIKNCIICQKNKSFSNRQGKLNNFIVSKDTKKIISSEIFGPNIDDLYTNKTKQYILTFTDIFQDFRNFTYCEILKQQWW